MNYTSKNDLKTINRLYLNVPYELKDEIRILGGKWDSDRKKWYILKNASERTLEKTLNLKHRISLATVQVPKYIKSDECIENDYDKIPLQDKFNLDLVYKNHEITQLFKEAKQEVKQKELPKMNKSQWFCCE